jgi:hypothetical protein
MQEEKKGPPSGQAMTGQLIKILMKRYNSGQASATAKPEEILRRLRRAEWILREARRLADEEVSQSAQLEALFSPTGRLNRTNHRGAK